MIYNWAWLRSMTEGYDKPHRTPRSVGVVVGMTLTVPLNRCVYLQKTCKQRTSPRLSLGYPGTIIHLYPGVFLVREQFGAWQSTAQRYIGVRLWGQLGD